MWKNDEEINPSMMAVTTYHMSFSGGGLLVKEGIRRGIVGYKKITYECEKNKEDVLKREKKKI